MPPSEQIEDIVEYIYTSIQDGALEGTGNAPDKRVAALVNTLESTGDLIVQEYFDRACKQLSVVLQKCDGQIPPPDFLQDVNESGATGELTNMIIALMEDLDCE